LAIPLAQLAPLAVEDSAGKHVPAFTSVELNQTPSWRAANG
jgi:hypothetical protein